MLGLLDAEFHDLPLDMNKAVYDPIRIKLARHLVHAG